MIENGLGVEKLKMCNSQSLIHHETRTFVKNVQIVGELNETYERYILTWESTVLMNLKMNM